MGMGRSEGDENVHVTLQKTLMLDTAPNMIYYSLTLGGVVAWCCMWQRFARNLLEDNDDQTNDVDDDDDDDDDDDGDEYEY